MSRMQKHKKKRRRYPKTGSAKKMTERQQIFVEEAAELLEAGVPVEEAGSHAAALANCDPKFSSEMLAKPNVTAGIEAARTRPGSKTACAAVLSEPLTRVERRALLADIARPAGGCKAGDQLTAIRLDGQMEGDFIERKQIDARILTKDLSKLSDEELAKIALQYGGEETADEQE